MIQGGYNSERCKWHEKELESIQKDTHDLERRITVMEKEIRAELKELTGKLSNMHVGESFKQGAIKALLTAVSTVAALAGLLHLLGKL